MLGRLLLALSLVAGAPVALSAQRSSEPPPPPPTAARRFHLPPGAWQLDTIPAGSLCFALAYGPRLAPADSAGADTAVDVLPTHLTLAPEWSWGREGYRWEAARWRPRATLASHELFRLLRGRAEVSRGAGDTVVVSLDGPFEPSLGGRLALRRREGEPWRGVATWVWYECEMSCPSHHGKHVVTATPIPCAEGRWRTRR